MARTEANPTPAVLKWARESAGLTPELAARKATVAAERLSAWETGELRPTFAQLRKLSEVYKRPLAAFYLANPPKRFQAMHDFRRPALHEERQSHSPELTMEIRKAHDRREWAIELIESIGEHAPHFTTRITRHQNPESAAATVRDFLGVSLDKQRAWRDQYEALKCWRRLIEKVGILTFQALGVEVDEARGFSISDMPLPVAVVNVKDAPRGRIFTLLHEVAHILLRGGGICDLHQSHDDENSHVEAFCNHVAGAVLFPRDELLATETVRRHQGGDRAWSDDELRDISRQFGGSREAALVRLLTLGLTNDAYYQQRRTEFLRQYAEWKRQQKGFAMPHVVAVSSAGEAFAGLVLENFNRERITASDVSDYLGIRAKHLPEIQRDYSNLAV